MNNQNSVAIIGAGFSGLMLACRLVKIKHLKVFLIGPTDTPGCGLAYSTKNKLHLLNVRADYMSAFADEPLDFYNWLVKTKKNFTAKDFVPRMIYAEYLASLWNQVSEEVTHIKAKAICINQRSEIELDNQTSILATTIILATGNNPPFPIAGCVSTFSYSGDPQNLKKIGIIGTGLTAVDCIIELESRGFKGCYTLISRRGLLPLSHSENFEQPVTKADYPENLKDLISFFRKEAKDTVCSWQQLIDGFRPKIQQTWGKFRLREKQSFLRHLRPFWDIHRHRIPSQIARQIQELRDSKRLEIRKANASQVLASDFDLVFNCTGPETSLKSRTPEFISSLIQNGFVEKDELELGLNVNQHLRVGKRDGVTIYAVGALLAGTLWESVSVPELRGQVEQIGEEILGGFSGPKK